MAELATELIRWLNTLPAGASIGIDEGGLALQMVGDEDVYYEVGGLPEGEDEEIGDEGEDA